MLASYNWTGKNSLKQLKNFLEKIMVKLLGIS
jgi:hypothetical protein